MADGHRALGLAHQDPGPLGIDVRLPLGNAAEQEAVRVFAANLRDLLLAAPAGARATMGLDPGFRTGVKVAVVDATGKVVATDTIYPHDLKRPAAGRGPRPGERDGWRRSPSSAGWQRPTGSSSSRSATGPRRGRPTDSPRNCCRR